MEAILNLRPSTDQGRRVRGYQVRACQVRASRTWAARRARLSGPSRRARSVRTGSSSPTRLCCWLRDAWRSASDNAGRGVSARRTFQLPQGPADWPRPEEKRAQSTAPTAWGLSDSDTPTPALDGWTVAPRGRRQSAAKPAVIGRLAPHASPGLERDRPMKALSASRAVGHIQCHQPSAAGASSSSRRQSIRAHMAHKRAVGPPEVSNDVALQRHGTGSPCDSFPYLHDIRCRTTGARSHRGDLR